MAQGTELSIPELGGAAAYPRRNGEPVFEEPWQSRAFGMVVSLHRQGFYPWDDFKERLIEEIASADCKGPSATAPTYYEHFLAAFWRLLVEKGILSEGEMEARKAEFESGAKREVY
jgi:nitrile hydratase accessory protein